MSARKALGVVAIVAIALYAGYLGLLYFWQDSILFPGTKNQVGAEPPYAQDAEVFKILTASGNVEAIFLPAALRTNSTTGSLRSMDFAKEESVFCWLSILGTGDPQAHHQKSRLGS